MIVALTLAALHTWWLSVVAALADKCVLVKNSTITITLLKCKMYHRSIKRLNGYKMQCVLPSFPAHPHISPCEKRINELNSLNAIPFN